MRRRSEAYDDPLRKRSIISTIGKGSQVSKLKPERERLVTVQEDQIEWSNLMFLPFHPVFKLFVLFSVFIKAVLGPIQSVYPIVYCSDTMDYHPFLIFIKYSYWYICDSIYGIDTFLHIVHRQVVDKAMRREHLPKSALLLMLDLISLIPFFRMVERSQCPPARIWPNVLAFNEFLIVYRVTQYFSLMTTHSYTKIVIGYGFVLAMCVNCISCFWLLLTYEGFCEHCTDPSNYFDWRAYVLYKFNETKEDYATFVYGAVFVYSFAIGIPLDETKPSAILEFLIICVFMVAGYVVHNFIILPKCCAESLLRFRKIFSKYPKIRKVIDETKRRNPKDNSDQIVENYYKLLWRKQNCIVKTPRFFLDLPRYLKLEIHQDLQWPLFHHSPTLRATSFPFRCWLNQCTKLDFRLPGQKLFTGTESNGNLFYLKSGIVQLTSIDDGATPILSVTSGTIFGDISFIVPHKRRKVLTRCLTYCEVFYIDRKDILTALHIYQEDKKVIMENVNNRLKHARTLFKNKTIIRGKDRNEDEGIAWLKRRWWEISNYFHEYTEITGKSLEAIKKNTLAPREEAIYHCAKYLGQLVLCNKIQLQTKSMFTRSKFPWILNRYSRFGYEWNRIVYITVVLVLLLYPQNLIKENVPKWFHFFSFCVDTVYILDIGVSLFTALQLQDSVTSSFATVLFERFKTITFILDLIATIWIEDFANFAGADEYFYTLQFNRLIKIYILFYGDYLAFDIRKDPMVDVCRKIVLIHLAFLLLTSHIVFDLLNYLPNLSMQYFFGEKLCHKTRKEPNCEPVDPLVGVAVSWAFETTYFEHAPLTLFDIYIAIGIKYTAHIIYYYCRGTIIAYMYLKNRNMINYQNFVKNLKQYYEHYSIHHDLLKRLDRYVVCHWKYYKGTDILYSNSLEDEAYAIYWKAQGSVAENIIINSPPLKYCDPALVKDLALAGKFLLLPRNQPILMFGVTTRNVMWVVQGFVKAEYHDENGELVTTYYGNGSGLALTSIFLQRISLRSYTTYTECEILYIPVKAYIDIFKSYPIEYSFVETCVREFASKFDEMFKRDVLKHKDYQDKLRDRIYSTRMSTVTTTKVIVDMQDYRSLPVEGVFWADPESSFIKSWMLFRVIIVCISIISASMLGGVGAVFRWIFMMLSAFCDCIAWIDIVIKLCLPFYKDNGLLITNRKRCLINYLTKGFLLDIIGTAPWFSVLKALLTQEIDDDSIFLINTFCKFAHIYILFAYCQYISDTPSANVTIVMIVKWQIVNILMVMPCSHYLMVNCVHFSFNENMVLTFIGYRNTCWMPNIFEFPPKLTGGDLHLIFAQSLNFAESAMMRMNLGRFMVDRRHLGVGIILYSLGLLFWFISCYTLVLLVLRGRGNTRYQQGVHQLIKFLKSERVEKDVIQHSLDHFTYCWKRTHGINIEQVTNERLGVVFKQDLSFYFYKKTFTILASILSIGETIQRHLASASELAYFLPGQDIFREMDLVDHVYIVHRGRVNIIKGDKRIFGLSKGDIFGQLKATKVSPVHITARAEDHVDVLYISIEAFQSAISAEVKRTISISRQARNFFMAKKHVVVENPYDSIPYLLRGRKTIMLPWRKTPTEAFPGTWYYRWLYLVWLINPYVGTAVVVFFTILTEDSVFWTRFYIVAFTTDLFCLANFIAEFYTLELIVSERKCVYKRLGLKKFKNWGIYMEILSMLIPIVSLITKHWEFQLARLLRLKCLLDFHINFCRDFQSHWSPTILKFVITTLIIHLFTCGWITFACREPVFPISIPSTHEHSNMIDFSEWSAPNERVGGCARTTKNILDEHGNMVPSFVVPRKTPHDYIVAVTYILLICTHTSLDSVLAVNIKQVYYKVFVTFFMYLLDMWIMAVAINYAFTKYRELYHYDYNVLNMISYLTDNHISKSLKETVLDYTKQVWERERGDWLPEIVYSAPLCLREDIFTSLYIHHLDQLPTFDDVPFYFKRQLAARFRRVVIFPGKCIVQEGDTFSTTYFIHQGEVEKWFTDPSGEGQLLSLLNTNSYFGVIAGLFRNLSFQFSYYSRTVVDLVYLELSQWKDLLDAYPDIADILYEATNRFKDTLNKTQYGKTVHPSRSSGTVV